MNMEDDKKNKGQGGYSDFLEHNQMDEGSKSQRDDEKKQDSSGNSDEENYN
jgi:hypothetical protein